MSHEQAGSPFPEIPSFQTEEELMTDRQTGEVLWVIPIGHQTLWPMQWQIQYQPGEASVPPLTCYDTRAAGVTPATRMCIFAL